LQHLMANAALNGVDDLVLLNAEQVRDMEPEIVCVAACLSPSTGIVDTHGYMQALEGSLMAHGGQVVLRNKVSAATVIPCGAFKLFIESDEESYPITSRYIVNAAGLGASRIGRFFGGHEGYRVPQTFPAKGHYFHLSGASPVSHLIYPMPSGAWLGVHLTLDWTGKVKFGPDLEWLDRDDGVLDYSFDGRNGRRQQLFEREIRRYWPGLPVDALFPDYTGIRPKIYRKGEPVADFAIHDERDHGIAGLVSLYGIESPGLTASLAIGSEVARRLS
ncbi:MAG: FAD-dependent oxidoreductase, partial [Kiloniellales bacterium]|nr:FAD-dependent oxidoreductase [Kiloniellales bacterium]